MNYQNMKLAVNEAQETLRATELISDTIAQMLRGKLRAYNISGSVLEEFKKELKKFNMHTYQWKD